MDEQLTKADLDFILVSLDYTRERFEKTQDYPSYEFKRKRLDRVEEVVSRIKKLKTDWID